MPKFEVVVASTTYYKVVVGAPQLLNAVQWFHRHSDGSEFEERETGSWDYDETHAVDDSEQASIVVDDMGHPVTQTQEKV